MRVIQDLSAFFFIGAVAILGGISIFGIWDIFDIDVVTKSFMTLGLLAFVAVIIMTAGRFMESKPAGGSETIVVPNPAFASLRKMSLAVLIISAALLALLGVLAIWEVISDKDVLYKSLGSLAVIAFVSFIIVMTCREREGTGAFGPERKGLTPGMIIGLIILGWLMITLLGGIF